MAKSKHNATGNGTHRQRVFKFRQSQIAAAKLAAELEAQSNVGQECRDDEKPKFEILPEVTVDA